MILLYTSPGCASCRKAKAWLKDNHISYVEKNIFSNKLGYNELNYLLKRSENGTSDIISTRSNAFKELNKDLDDFSLNELIRFIQQNPSVLKRPIMLSEKSIIIGYDEDEITTFVERDPNGRHITIPDTQPGLVHLEPQS